MNPYYLSEGVITFFRRFLVEVRESSAASFSPSSFSVPSAFFLFLLAGVDCILVAGTGVDGEGGGGSACLVLASSSSVGERNSGEKRNRSLQSNVSACICLVCTHHLFFSPSLSQLSLTIFLPFLFPTLKPWKTHVAIYR